MRRKGSVERESKEQMFTLVSEPLIRRLSAASVSKGVGSVQNTEQPQHRNPAGALPDFSRLTLRPSANPLPTQHSFLLKQPSSQEVGGLESASKR